MRYRQVDHQVGAPRLAVFKTACPERSRRGDSWVEQRFSAALSIGADLHRVISNLYRGESAPIRGLNFLFAVSTVSPLSTNGPWGSLSYFCFWNLEKLGPAPTRALFAVCDRISE